MSTEHATAQQPKPHGIDVDIATLVQQDIEARARTGEQKYGERLKPFNGRNGIIDLYQELLDGAQYARQVMFELQAMKEENNLLKALLMECVNQLHTGDELPLSHYVNNAPDSLLARVAKAVYQL